MDDQDMTEHPALRLHSGEHDTNNEEKEAQSLGCGDAAICPEKQNVECHSHQQNISSDKTNKTSQNDNENLVDRLISMAVGEDGKSEDEDDEEDFLSASDGESEDEKIQEWIETASEPVDSFQANSNTPSAPTQNVEHKFNTQSESKFSEDSLPQQENSAAAADTKGESPEEIEADVNPADEKEEDILRKEEEERERKRQEEEDALTEEERQTRLAEAVKIKNSGNSAFKEGRYREATDLYTQSLELCPLKYVQQRSVMLSNRAACHMKELGYDDALSDCSKAIELQPTYIKAIARRADANEKLEKLEEALKDHQNILTLDRSQAHSYHAAMRLENEIKERNEKLKEEMLGKLKDLGNLVLRPFGLSTNNFQLNQDLNSGGYSVQFVQNPPNNGH